MGPHPTPRSFALLHRSERQSGSRGQGGAGGDRSRGGGTEQRGSAGERRRGRGRHAEPSRLPSPSGADPHSPLRQHPPAPAEVSALCSSSFFCSYNFLWVTTKAIVSGCQPRTPKGAGRALGTGEASGAAQPCAHPTVSRAAAPWWQHRSGDKTLHRDQPVPLEGKLRHGGSSEGMSHGRGRLSGSFWPDFRSTVQLCYLTAH